ncbi:LysR family transcriptional regulator [Acetobacter persici]|uniref:LysR family transcriptional regulator n=1 Tax=Acetobacter TaxID=434 RepID=UPI001BAA22B0|nr:MULTISPECIES: LysR family transcriptional regulator [Acetobacter]MBS1000126.1 LysR family transcriptional regulator [Acetobacter persici]MCG4262285.1 LysR family transcriptional regulator [Acetobacter senegalensis]
MLSRSVAKRLPAASDLDLATLRIFVAVAEAGSFVSGGKAVGLTRSAAGKAVARLESYLETRLFQRTTRQVSMTAEGRELFHRSVQILEDMADAEASVRANASSPRGTLRLTVSEGYGKAKIIPFLTEYLETVPDLSVEVSFTDRVVDLVEEGFDLAIRVGATVSSTQYITQVIDRTPLGLYASPSYLARCETPNCLEDLSCHLRLTYGLAPAPTAWSFPFRGAAPTIIDGPSRIRFDSGDAVKVAAIAGLGIALLPESIVETHLQSGELISILPKVTCTEVDIRALYPSRRHLSLRTRHFLDGLKQFSCRSFKKVRDP